MFQILNENLPIFINLYIKNIEPLYIYSVSTGHATNPNPLRKGRRTERLDSYIFVTVAVL